jgi:hypothetical protein
VDPDSDPDPQLWFGSIFFGGLKDLDPDPVPSINKPNKIIRNHDFFCFVTSQ